MDTDIIVGIGKAALFLIGSVIGSVITNWWNKKTAARKTDFLKDFVGSIRDGKLTKDEIADMVEEHAIN